MMNFAVINEPPAAKATDPLPPGRARLPTDAATDLLEHSDQLEHAALALKAMAHPLRLRILCTLVDHEASVHQIAEAVGTSQSNASQHLGMLRDHGVLRTRRDANYVHYRIADARMVELIGLMRDLFARRGGA